MSRDNDIMVGRAGISEFRIYFENEGGRGFCRYKCTVIVK